MKDTIYQRTSHGKRHTITYTQDELMEAVDQYMRYYNHERPQWDRNKMTPVQYRDHLLETQLSISTI